MATRTRQNPEAESWRAKPENMIGLRITFSRLLRALSCDQGNVKNREHAEKMAVSLAESLAKHFELAGENLEKSS